MRTVRVNVVVFFLGFLSVVAKTANATPILNLDATQVGSPPSVAVTLAAGTYTVTPVGIAGGGTFDAWSAWSANLGCGVDHICERGWESEYEYTSPSLGYVYAWDGFRYDDPLIALSHGVPSTFTLLTSETVTFGLNDCAPGCLGDNRGGNSLQIDEVPAVPAVPEPASLVLLTTGIVGLAARRWRRRANSVERSGV